MQVRASLKVGKFLLRAIVFLFASKLYASDKTDTIKVNWE